jgi:hypothetical protein
MAGRLLYYGIEDFVANIQVFILRKTYTCSFVVFLSRIHISSLVDGRTCASGTSYMEDA